MINDLIVALIGAPPVGYEYLSYVVASFFAVFMVKSMIRFVYSMFALAVPNGRRGSKIK